MLRNRRSALLAVLAAACLAAATACSTTVAGTATWPGASLEKVLLTGADFPDGVVYTRISQDPGQPDGAGGPSAMLSRPEGCSDGLTDVIARTAERGPGSAASYSVGYDGARIAMTVLSWHLDLDAIAATAARCERFEAYFDPSAQGIPMTTVRVDSPDSDALVYRQTMTLAGTETSVYMAFENVGPMAVFGVAFPTPNPTIAVKASLPQTFQDLLERQRERVRSG